MAQAKMDALFTIKQAAAETGFDERQIMYKIRKKQLEGAQKVGWIWVITQEGVDQLKDMKKQQENKQSKRKKKKD